MNILSSDIAIQDQVRHLGAAIKMFQLGARPPVVRAMVPVKTRVAGQLYLEMTGKNPPRGMLVASTEWFFQVAKRNRQGATFIKIFKAACAEMSGELEAEVLIEAYQRYLEQIGIEEVCLTLDRAWWLLREVKIRNLLVEACCKKCGVDYLVENGTLRVACLCQSCMRQI